MVGCTKLPKLGELPTIRDVFREAYLDGKLLDDSRENPLEVLTPAKCGDRIEVVFEDCSEADVPGLFYNGKVAAASASAPDDAERKAEGKASAPEVHTWRGTSKGKARPTATPSRITHQRKAANDYRPLTS